MSFFRWLAIAAIAITPAVHAAQNPAESIDPADPSAAAAPFRYESAFSSYRSVKSDEATPDKVWRAANEEMGRLGGHAGHMKDGNTSLAPSSGNVGNATAASSAQPSAMPANHSGHGMHHLPKQG